MAQTSPALRMAPRLPPQNNRVPKCRHSPEKNMLPLIQTNNSKPSVPLKNKPVPLTLPNAEIVGNNLPAVPMVPKNARQSQQMALSAIPTAKYKKKRPRLEAETDLPGKKNNNSSEGNRTKARLRGICCGQSGICPIGNACAAANKKVKMKNRNTTIPQISAARATPSNSVRANIHASRTNTALNAQMGVWGSKICCVASAVKRISKAATKKSRKPMKTARIRPIFLPKVNCKSTKNGVLRQSKVSATAQIPLYAPLKTAQRGADCPTCSTSSLGKNNMPEEKAAKNKIAANCPKEIFELSENNSHFPFLLSNIEERCKKRSGNRIKLSFKSS